jgi:hypothetical protein
MVIYATGMCTMMSHGETALPSRMTTMSLDRVVFVKLRQRHLTFPNMKRKLNRRTNKMQYEHAGTGSS